ncbi:MAG: hypothetical protein L0Y45_07940, partial [Woeseiaceae bacterium]|nr:hypothetical protein [Woeseiaceae bacterium]
SIFKCQWQPYPVVACHVASTSLYLSFSFDQYALDAASDVFVAMLSGQGAMKVDGTATTMSSQTVPVCG